MSGCRECGPVERAPKKPVMRYHGSKWNLALWIISHFPAHSIYVEPFGGGGSVLLQKGRAACEILNDIDREVVNVFRVLRDPELSERLAELLALTPFAEVEFDLSYKRTRDRVEQARRTILRGFLGCGSRGTTGADRTGFRYADNSGTVGHKVWAKYPDSIQAFCGRLSGVAITCRPAIKLIQQMDGKRDSSTTLYYCDPPYLHSTRENGSTWRRSYRHDMTDDDHRQLAEVLRSVRGFVVLSGYPSALYDELYPDWERVESRAWADGAKERTECLWLSPRVSEWMRGRLLL